MSRLATALALLSVWPLAGFGHAFLSSAEPRVGAVIPASPPTIVLNFDSELERSFSGFRVEDAQGHVVLEDKKGGDPAHPKQLSMPCPTLAAGSYRVSWSVVSRDGHPSAGTYTFTIR